MRSPCDLREEADELRRELGDIRPEDLGLERISAEQEIPSKDVEHFLRSFELAASWQDAMRQLAVQGPPGGSPQELAEEVDRIMEEHPIQFLFTKALVAPTTSAIFRSSTPEQHRRLAVAEQRAQQARMLWGVFCSQALQRIRARPDRPNRPALAKSLSGAFIEPE